VVTRNVLLLTGSIAAIGANALVLSPIAGAVAGSFDGVDAPGVMTAMAVYGLATAAGALLLAPAIDRIGAGRALLRALLLLVVALALSAAAPSLALLCLAQGLAGLAAGTALPAVYALSAQVAPKGRESETLGLVLTGWTLSLVAGVSLSALVADLAHWRAVFAALSLAAAGLALALARVREPGALPAAGRPSTPLTALRVPGIGAALLAVASYMTAFYGLYAYLGAHLGGALGVSTGLIGLAPLAYGLGFGIALPLDRLIDRHGAPAAAPLAFAALALVYLALAASADSAVLLTALALAWGLANHLGLNLIVGRLTALDPRQRGTVMGLYSAVTYLAVTLGALAYRPVFEQLGFAACALLSAACIAPALAAALGRARTVPEAW